MPELVFGILALLIIAAGFGALLFMISKKISPSNK